MYLFSPLLPRCECNKILQFSSNPAGIGIVTGFLRILADMVEKEIIFLNAHRSNNAPLPRYHLTFFQSFPLQSWLK